MNQEPKHLERRATFRFYEELNDFLPLKFRKTAFDHVFNGTPAVKDVIEAIGVPHPEIDLIVVDGVSVGFDHRLSGGERVAVYPMFECIDISPIIRLRPKPLREPRFVLDVHLGKLARYLRLLGFDSIYERNYDDATLAAISRHQRRILLTRDQGWLKRNEVTHGYWVRATRPHHQITEIVEALDLRRNVHPFSRCMVCNHVLDFIPEAAVRGALPSAVRGRFEQVSHCPSCERLYWPGSHYDRLVTLVSHWVSPPDPRLHRPVAHRPRVVH